MMEKVLEMKPCKECGKLFRPKSNKTIYCDGEHYRPCPVCGKPVFAKYLSDPARCCSGVCRAELGRRNKGEAPKEIVADTTSLLDVAATPVEELTTIKIDLDNIPKKTYVGKDSDGFISGHEYHINVTVSNTVYDVEAVYDATEGKPVSLHTAYNSKSTYYKKFKSVNQ